MYSLFKEDYCLQINSWINIFIYKKQKTKIVNMEISSNSSALATVSVVAFTRVLGSMLISQFQFNFAVVRSECAPKLWKLGLFKKTEKPWKRANLNGQVWLVYLSYHEVIPGLSVFYQLEKDKTYLVLAVYRPDTKTL